MEIQYKGRNVGSLGRVGTTYVFTIQTKKTHKTYELKAKTLSEAIKECQKKCDELSK